MFSRGEYSGEYSPRFLWTPAIAIAILDGEYSQSANYV